MPLVTLLPANATVASQQRAKIAERLVDACPSDLADEIALTGSTARGVADDDSDLELNLWCETLPPLSERVAWLSAAGATDVQVEDAPRPDNSHWIKFRLDGLPAEVGWQTVEALHARITYLQSGATLEREVLTFADVIASAIPLRGDQVTSGKLSCRATPTRCSGASSNWRSISGRSPGAGRPRGGSPVTASA